MLTYWVLGATLFFSLQPKQKLYEVVYERMQRFWLVPLFSTVSRLACRAVIYSIL